MSMFRLASDSIAAVACAGRGWRPPARCVRAAARGARERIDIDRFGADSTVSALVEPGVGVAFHLGRRAGAHGRDRLASRAPAERAPGLVADRGWCWSRRALIRISARI